MKIPNNKLFEYLSSDPVGLLFTVPEIANNPDHPMYKLLEQTLRTVEEEHLIDILQDQHFQWLNQGLGTDKLIREARIEYVRRLYDDEILIKRNELLSGQSEVRRPAPYEHESLMGVTIDDDFLVPLNLFEIVRGPLRRNGYAFGVVPPVPSINSAYWFMSVLCRPGIFDKTSVRLDPFLIRPAGDFPHIEYRGWWYGLSLDWTRIAQLKEEEHRRAGPDDIWTRKDILFTDIVWSPRGKEVHFICEEIPTHESINVRGSRYFHAIYVPEKEKFIHMDGAVRYFKTDEWDLRKDSHVRQIGKIGKRVKIFKLEGDLPIEFFCDLVQSFFYWNADIHRYLNDNA